jgi:predicted molibdopterin-dependent oxidoreductase YjgC
MENLRLMKECGSWVTVKINGATHTARAGETVHAALLASGIRPLRKTLKHEQGRGVLCGMGVCYECLVTVNGVSNVRACMTEIQANMEIETDEI